MKRSLPPCFLIVALCFGHFEAGGVSAQEEPPGGGPVPVRRTCGSPSPTEADRQRIALQPEGVVLDAAADIGTFLVPVRFHVIHDGPNDNVAESALDSQIDVLNRVFGPHGFRFHQAGTANRVDNSAWFRMASGSDEEEAARKALQREPERSLNFYLAEIQKFAGWAQSPWHFAGSELWDGVVVHHRYLPGGEPPLDLGMTGVHEVGHWLGLLHTYEGWDEKKAPRGGCQQGDDVDDTPMEASPAFGPGIGLACPPINSRDTCPPPNSGPDPIDNYMDTADDRCMARFTSGQVERMKIQTSRFRTQLVVSHDCQAFGTLSPAGRKRLLSNLRAGGLVIALRHADKDPEGRDRLTKTGRRQARRIGEAFKRLDIPISEVFYSPARRTTQTAKRLPKPRRRKVYLGQSGGLRGLLSDADQDLLDGRNLVAVTHGYVLSEEDRGYAAGCGEAFILDPSQPVGSRCLARVLPTEWTDPLGQLPRWENTEECPGGALTARGRH